MVIEKKIGYIQILPVICNHSQCKNLDKNIELGPVSESLELISTRVNFSPLDLIFLHSLTPAPNLTPEILKPALSVFLLRSDASRPFLSRGTTFGLNGQLVGCVFMQNFELLEIPPHETEKRSNLTREIEGLE